MNLRDEIVEMDLPLRDKIVLLLAEANTSVPPLTYYEVSKDILTLISEQRCEWTSFYVDDDSSLSNSGIAAGNYVGWNTTSATAGATYAIITFEGFYQ